MRIDVFPDGRSLSGFRHNKAAAQVIAVENVIFPRLYTVNCLCQPARITKGMEDGITLRHFDPDGIQRIIRGAADHTIIFRHKLAAVFVRRPADQCVAFTCKSILTQIELVAYIVVDINGFLTVKHTAVAVKRDLVFDGKSGQGPAIARYLVINAAAADDRCIRGHGGIAGDRHIGAVDADDRSINADDALALRRDLTGSHATLVRETHL